MKHIRVLDLRICLLLMTFIHQVHSDRLKAHLDLDTNMEFMSRQDAIFPMPITFAHTLSLFSNKSSQWYLPSSGCLGRRRGTNRHPRHSRSRRLRRHPRQLLPERRGFPLRLFDYGGRQLPVYPRVQRTDSQGERRRRIHSIYLGKLLIQRN